MTRSLLLGALLVCPARDALGDPAPAQPRPSPAQAHDLPRLREWLDAVDRHVPGQIDGAAIVVGSWSRAQVEVLYVDLRSLLQQIVAPPPQKPKFPATLRAFTDPERLDLLNLAQRELQRTVGPEVILQNVTTRDHERKTVNRLVKRGTLLHTDIAMRSSSAADRPSDTPIPVLRPMLDTLSSLQVDDGRAVASSYYGAHWDVARLLLGEITPDATADPTVRQWYRVVAALLESNQVLSELGVHLTRARQLFPSDPEILAASGRMREAYAAPRIQHVIEGGRSDLEAAIGSTRTNLRQAEGFFRRALDADAGLVDARLHLGRVLGLQGRHDDAAVELRRAATTAVDSTTQYYAWLFLGVEEQSLGRADRAREAFECAVLLYPRAQSPHLALSQLSRRGGDLQGALRAIQHVTELSGADRKREDPWSRYLEGDLAQVDPQLSALRAVLFLTPEER